MSKKLFLFTHREGGFLVRANECPSAEEVADACMIPQEETEIVALDEATVFDYD
jgi:hypothetical protein